MLQRSSAENPHINPAVPTSERMGALRRHPLWNSASDLSVRTIAHSAHDLSLKPKERLFHAGEQADSIFLLISGAMRMFYPSRDVDTQITVKLFRAPAAFGESEALAEQPWGETVEALTQARVFRVPLRAYLEVLKREPEIAVRHYRDLGARFSIAIHRARTSEFGDTTQRLVALLASYANHFGRPAKDGKSLLIDRVLTRDELALQIGSNRRSVSRALSNLALRGFIQRRGRKYLVPCIDRLLAIRLEKSSLAYTCQTGVELPRGRSPS